MEGRNYYVCSRRSEGCTFALQKCIRGAKLSPEDMSALLDGKTSRMFAFTWKNGNQGKAAFRLKEEGQLDWVFAN